jgi:hypothetical protein
MKVPWKRFLIIADVVVLVALVLIGIDAYVRWRVGQGISGYHATVITPLITPRPAPQPPMK